MPSQLIPCRPCAGLHSETQPGLWADRTARPYLTSAFTASATDYPLTGPSGPAVRGLFGEAVTR